jgi:hypothetical protein
MPRSAARGRRQWRRTARNRPTIAHLKGHGLQGLFVTCANVACQHSVPFTFAALDLADDVEFPSIVQRLRSVCTQCGARTVSVMPDWRTHKASAMGRRAYVPHFADELQPPVPSKGSFWMTTSMAFSIGLSVSWFRERKVASIKSKTFRHSIRSSKLSCWVISSSHRGIGRRLRK